MNTTKVIFDCPLPPWVVVAGALVVLAVALFFLRRDAGHLKPLVRRGILALAVVAGVMLAGIALGPKIIRTWPDPQKPSPSSPPTRRPTSPAPPSSWTAACSPSSATADRPRTRSPYWINCRAAGR